MIDWKDIRKELPPEDADFSEITFKFKDFEVDSERINLGENGEYTFGRRIYSISLNDVTHWAYVKNQ